MKDMRVMSGTKSQAFPTSSPLYLMHSVLVSDDHVAFIGCGGGNERKGVTMRRWDVETRIKALWAHQQRPITVEDFASSLCEAGLSLRRNCDKLNLTRKCGAYLRLECDTAAMVLTSFTTSSCDCYQSQIIELKSFRFNSGKIRQLLFVNIY